VKKYRRNREFQFTHLSLVHDEANLNKRICKRDRRRGDGRRHYLLFTCPPINEVHNGLS